MTNTDGNRFEHTLLYINTTLFLRQVFQLVFQEQLQPLRNMESVKKGLIRVTLHHPHL